MATKRNRGKINLFLWYSSGLTLRDLSGNLRSGSNYFAIGGINVFSSVLIALLSIVSFEISFPKINLLFSSAIGIVTGLVIYIFNRQTTFALSITDRNTKRRNLSLTMLPFALFALVAGVVISIGIKFQLFEIRNSGNLFERLKSLNAITDAGLSAQFISWSISVVISVVIALPTLMQYYTLKSSAREDRSSMLNELMWYCSGSNKDIIRRCPNDYSKYFGIGGTILFTALMASLSGGYAFYTAFNNSGLAIWFGLFWGAMIFNLDRFIVNTMYSDNKHTISWQEVWSGLPRIIMAIFLGIVISYPLELKLFEDQINARIENLKYTNKIESDSLSNEAFSIIYSTDADIKQLEIQKNKLIRQQDSAKEVWDLVEKIPVYWFTDSLGIRHTRMVWPDDYYVKESNYNTIHDRNVPELARIEGRIKTLENENASTKNSKTDMDRTKDATINALDDLSTRMEAFAKLKEEKPAIALASMFIMILLIIIEISPVFFKMMLASGDYEVILEQEKNRIKVEETVRMSEQNDWANTEITKMVEENRRKITLKQNELNAELKANEELLEAIASAQADIAKIAIDKWKEAEIKKATENPGDFLTTNRDESSS